MGISAGSTKLQIFPAQKTIIVPNQVRLIGENRHGAKKGTVPKPGCPGGCGIYFFKNNGNNYLRLNENGV